MIIFYALLFNLLSIVFFERIGRLFKIFNLSFIKSTIFGYSLFTITNYILYFFLNANVGIIVQIWLLIIIILSINCFLTFNKYLIELSRNKFVLLLVLIVSAIYILPPYIYGQQFYIFRGNHWDTFSYLSISSLFGEYNFLELNQEEFPKEYQHFDSIESLIYSRPVTSLLISILNQLSGVDIFLTTYFFKTLLIILSTISFYEIIQNLKLSRIEKKTLVFIFPFSFWLIYIFEIDALSHLASISIFLLLITEITKIDKDYLFKKNFLLYIGLLKSALFLIYPELFIILLIIFAVYLFYHFIESDRKKKYIENLILLFLIFIIITFPSYKTNYLFLISQVNSTLNSQKDWWGYFGAFILGKENLVSNKEFVILLKNYLYENNNFQTLIFIINSHLSEGYKFFYLNIIPSFFGLYHVSVDKIESHLEWFHLFFIILLNFYLLRIFFLNFFHFLRDKKLFTCFLIFACLLIFLIFKGNFWALIKFYTFISPYIFLFITINFRSIYLIKKLKLNVVFIILIIFFPLYKFYPYNQGIGKIDSFPSIIHPKMKTDFNWNINDKKLKKCDYIDAQVDDYFKKSFLILKFINFSIDSNILNNQYLDQTNKCNVTIKNNIFYINIADNKF